jgi:hypothetical protein
VCKAHQVQLDLQALQVKQGQRVHKAYKAHLVVLVFKARQVYKGHQVQLDLLARLVKLEQRVRKVFKVQAVQLVSKAHPVQLDLLARLVKLGQQVRRVSKAQVVARALPAQLVKQVQLDQVFLEQRVKLRSLIRLPRSQPTICSTGTIPINAWVSEVQVRQNVLRLMVPYSQSDF